MVETMLTTVDNPYDPFDEFEEWYAFDLEKGHNCCGIMAANAYTSPEFSERKMLDDIEEGIDRFLANDILGLYVKVSHETDYELSED